MGPGSSESDLFAVPRGALRILARNDDREVMILHGEDRAIESDERLAIIEWFPSIAVAEAVSHECSRLLAATQFHLNRGWHGFPVEHLPKLVQVAKNHLNVTYHPPPIEPKERQAWTAVRNARLAFLAGQGWTAKMIAADPLVRSTPTMVYRQARKLEVHLSEATQGQVSFRLSVGVLSFYEAAGERVRMTRDAYMRRLLISNAEQAPGREAAAA